MKPFTTQGLRRLTKAPTVLLRAVCLTICSTGISLAQTPSPQAESPEAEAQRHGNEGRWFQVEILLFTQPNQTAAEETWPTNIALAYPPNWKKLSSLNPILTTQETVPNRPSSQAIPVQTSEHPDPTLLLATEPYFSLPEAERLLGNNVRDLERSPKHRILYHQAWRQQVWGADEAPSLLIQGGRQYGEHFELEGSINLSVARYLHLKTNLWFTEFENNYGQESNDYPPLPPLPSLTPETGELDFLDQSESPWDRIEVTASEYEKILEQPYITRRVITMKQKRRMRSKEIHYVDHPVIGMVIYIVPYELPETEAEDDTIMEQQPAINS
ncbi:MAG: hypothetical protein AseanaTS_24190 [Candidatus Pelagadaptatus aseana]|uniref:CsiV family protein n=1 Tax=Candidatus Pelagadaptatus aseana TaxID=3120508 RepID=UPI0039B29156